MIKANYSMNIKVLLWCLLLAYNSAIFASPSCSEFARLTYYSHERDQLQISARYMRQMRLSTLKLLAQETGRTMRNLVGDLSAIMAVCGQHAADRVYSDLFYIKRALDARIWYIESGVLADIPMTQEEYSGTASPDETQTITDYEMEDDDDTIEF